MTQFLFAIIYSPDKYQRPEFWTRYETSRPLSIYFHVVFRYKNRHYIIGSLKLSEFTQIFEFKIILDQNFTDCHCEWIRLVIIIWFYRTHMVFQYAESIIKIKAVSWNQKYNWFNLFGLLKIKQATIKLSWQNDLEHQQLADN